MLIASPAEGEFGLHQFEKTIEGEGSQNEKEGDKHRRKKHISHKTPPVGGMFIPKGDAKFG